MSDGAGIVHRGRVEWADTDAAGIHHHTAVARYVEAAEAALMRELALADYFRNAPRVHYEVDFESTLRFGQEVTTTLQVARLGRSSMTLTFEVWGEAHLHRQRARAARGSYVTVHISGTHAGGDARSAPWPAAWATALRTPSPAGPGDPAQSGA